MIATGNAVPDGPSSVRIWKLVVTQDDAPNYLAKIDSYFFLGLIVLSATFIGILIEAYGAPSKCLELLSRGISGTVEHSTYLLGQGFFAARLAWAVVSHLLWLIIGGVLGGIGSTVSAIQRAIGSAVEEAMLHM